MNIKRWYYISVSNIHLSHRYQVYWYRAHLAWLRNNRRNSIPEATETHDEKESFVISDLVASFIEFYWRKGGIYTHAHIYIEAFSEKEITVVIEASTCDILFLSAIPLDRPRATDAKKSLPLPLIHPTNRRQSDVDRTRRGVDRCVYLCPLCPPIEMVLIAPGVHQHTNTDRPLAVFASRETLHSCVT